MAFLRASDGSIKEPGPHERDEIFPCSEDNDTCRGFGDAATSGRMPGPPLGRLQEPAPYLSRVLDCCETNGIRVRWYRIGACARDHERSPSEDGRQLLSELHAGSRHLETVKNLDWLLGTSNETDRFSIHPIDFQVLEILLTFPDHTIKMQTEFLADTIHLYMWGIGHSSSAVILTRVRLLFIWATLDGTLSFHRLCSARTVGVLPANVQSSLNAVWSARTIGVLLDAYLVREG